MNQSKKLSDLEDTIMRDACSPCGAASYLFECAVAKLESRGFITRRNEYSFEATDMGRAAWIAHR